MPCVPQCNSVHCSIVASVCGMTVQGRCWKRRREPPHPLPPCPPPLPLPPPLLLARTTPLVRAGRFQMSDAPPSASKRITKVYEVRGFVCRGGMARALLWCQLPVPLLPPRMLGGGGVGAASVPAAAVTGDLPPPAMAQVLAWPGRWACRGPVNVVWGGCVFTCTCRQRGETPRHPPLPCACAHSQVKHAETGTPFSRTSVLSSAIDAPGKHEPLSGEVDVNAFATGRRTERPDPHRFLTRHSGIGGNATTLMSEVRAGPATCLCSSWLLHACTAGSR
jgi:hypothetical protein